jgi:hypothetical protein
MTDKELQTIGEGDVGTITAAELLGEKPAKQKPVSKHVVARLAKRVAEKRIVDMGGHAVVGPKEQ